MKYMCTLSELLNLLVLVHMSQVSKGIHYKLLYFINCLFLHDLLCLFYSFFFFIIEYPRGFPVSASIPFMAW